MYLHTQRPVVCCLSKIKFRGQNLLYARSPDPLFRSDQRVWLARPKGAVGPKLSDILELTAIIA